VIELSQKLNHVKFIHSYGPTETTCTSHVYFCTNLDFNDCLQDRVFPIGKELPDVKSYALNDKMEIISPNEIGELYITGK
jgi:non-ribosomal peptide synthetase component F